MGSDMARWHLKKGSNEPGVCVAKGKCPLGYDEKHHYSSYAEAWEASEKANELRFRKIEDEADRPLNSLSRKYGDGAVSKPMPVLKPPLPPRSASSQIASSVPSPPRPAAAHSPKKSMSRVEIAASAESGKGMAVAAREAFASSVALPPLPPTQGQINGAGDRAITVMSNAGGKVVLAGFLPGLTNREKNLALEGLAAKRPDLSYDSVMGDEPFTAASYGDYVRAVEDKLRVDPGARAALSWSVREALPPLPPADSGRKPMITRSKMWETLS